MKNNPVDLETAKKLKEHGFKRECEYYWLGTELLKGHNLDHNSGVEMVCSAPDAYEAIDFLLDNALSKI